MKAKIKEALQQKYKNLGVSDKALDGVADFLSKTVKEESEIEQSVTGAETFLKAYQGDLDSLRGKNSSLEKELKTLKEEKKPQEPKENEPKPNDDISKLQAEIAAMREEQNRFKAEREANEVRTALVAKAKEAGISESFMNQILTGRNLTKETNIEEFVTEAKTGFDALRAEIANEKFGGGTPPDRGNGSADSDPFSAPVDKAKAQNQNN